MSSTLEITEKEYLIKLNKENFNLSFIRSLLKIVEVAQPSAKDDSYEEGDLHDELEIPDRRISPKQNTNAEPDYYGSLDEK